MTLKLGTLLNSKLAEVDAKAAKVARRVAKDEAVLPLLEVLVQPWKLLRRKQPISVLSFYHY